MIGKPRKLKELEAKVDRQKPIHDAVVHMPNPILSANAFGMLAGYRECWEFVLPVLEAASRGLYFIPMGQPEYKQLEDALKNLGLEDDRVRMRDVDPESWGPKE